MSRHDLHPHLGAGARPPWPRPGRSLWGTWSPRRGWRFTSKFPSCPLVTLAVMPWKDDLHPGALPVRRRSSRRRFARQHGAAPAGGLLQHPALDDHPLGPSQSWEEQTAGPASAAEEASRRTAARKRAGEFTSDLSGQGGQVRMIASAGSARRHAVRRALRGLPQEPRRIVLLPGRTGVRKVPAARPHRRGRDGGDLSRAHDGRRRASPSRWSSRRSSRTTPTTRPSSPCSSTRRASRGAVARQHRPGLRLRRDGRRVLPGHGVGARPAAVQGAAARARQGASPVLPACRWRCCIAIEMLQGPALRAHPAGRAAGGR